MGKAGKWIRNLLLGKKEEKANTSTRSIIPTSPSCSSATTRRRWSFRRSNTNTKKVVAVSHKSCRSFDSLITSQALFDYAIQQQKPATILPNKAVTAATKIQAAFRSYLAWKALCALRGLVKLQALVRGHLVRKRTTTMVRCMSALVAIQVRARFQRIQMADSRSHLGGAGKQGFLLARESPPQWEHSKNLGELGSNRQSSRRFSIDSSKLTHEISMRLHNKPIDEVSVASQTSRHHNEPNYMTRTNSSRAKARSNSEPRKRPTKQKHEKRRTLSNEGLHYATKGIRNHDHQKDHDSEFDSASTCTYDV